MEVKLTEQSIINIISMAGFIACVIAFIIKGSLTPEYVLPLFLTYVLPSPISDRMKNTKISKNTSEASIASGVNQVTTNNNEVEIESGVIEITDGSFEGKAE